MSTTSPRVRADSAGAVVRGVAMWINPLVAFGTLATIGASRSLGENPCVVALREAEQSEAGSGGQGGFRWSSRYPERGLVLRTHSRDVLASRTGQTCDTFHLLSQFNAQVFGNELRHLC